jgi:hypothetical protein
MEGALATAKMRLHDARREMIADQAELKKSSDACSWGTSCLSPPFVVTAFCPLFLSIDFRPYSRKPVVRTPDVQLQRYSCAGDLADHRGCNGKHRASCNTVFAEPGLRVRSNRLDVEPANGNGDECGQCSAGGDIGHHVGRFHPDKQLQHGRSTE